MAHEPEGYPAGSICSFIYRPRDMSVLLVRKASHKRQGGCWECPGGKIDYGETDEETAWREPREEVGDHFNPMTLEYYGCIGVVNDRDLVVKRQYITIIHLFFVAPGYDPEAVVGEPHNHDAVGWFSLRDIPTPWTTGLQAVLAELRRGGSFGPVPEEIIHILPPMPVRRWRDPYESSNSSNDTPPGSSSP
jgi:8-oxo-dGTP pyrophosphatase MutT (NUDIX family)